MVKLLFILVLTFATPLHAKSLFSHSLGDTQEIVLNKMKAQGYELVVIGPIKELKSKKSQAKKLLDQQKTCITYKMPKTLIMCLNKISRVRSALFFLFEKDKLSAITAMPNLESNKAFYKKVMLDFSDKFNYLTKKSVDSLHCRRDCSYIRWDNKKVKIIGLVEKKGDTKKLNIVSLMHNNSNIFRDNLH
jgi:hypothetical protein